MNPIQMLALAAGAFFVLKHFSETASPAPPASPAQVDPATPDLPLEPAYPQAPELPAESAQERYYSDSGFADAVHRNAAFGYANWIALADQIGVQFNIDQWNYIRENSGKQPISPDDMERLLFGRDRDELLQASTYHERLRSAGLGRVPRRFMRAWRAI